LRTFGGDAGFQPGESENGARAAIIGSARGHRKPQGRLVAESSRLGGALTVICCRGTVALAAGGRIANISCGILSMTSDIAALGQQEAQYAAEADDPQRADGRTDYC
jgi:hypothetical protein